MSHGPRRRASRFAALTTVLTFLLVAVAQTPANAAYSQIEGSGSTWSEVILRQWIADVSPQGMRVTYSGVGSSRGRQEFSQGTTDFGISEIPYQGLDELTGINSDNSERPYAYLPIVAGGTAFTYHLEQGGKLVKDIRLSGETIAKIFTGAITSWADPAIAADNNGRVFPATPIIPVYRSDGSGTSAQFTTWMNTVYPAMWKSFNGSNKIASYYPGKKIKGAIGASGSDQVMNTITAKTGNGAIGYVEYSYPTQAEYPVVKMKNAAGFFVEPTQYNVAVALTKAKINQDASSQLYLTQILDEVYSNSDPRAYPLSSYSYMILPIGAADKRMDTNKRQTLVDFMFYSLCEGQSKAGLYGYSPLPLNLVQAGVDQLGRLKDADPDVDLSDRDVTRCNNPTFTAGDLSRNHLAEIAPAPADCDKVGAGPCLSEGQSAVGTPAGGGSSGTSVGGTKTSTKGGTGGGSGGKTGAGGTADTGAVLGDSSVIDPETGEVLGDDSGSSLGAATGAVATDVAGRPAGNGSFFAGLAVAEFIAILVAPGALAVRARRRKASA